MRRLAGCVSLALLLVPGPVAAEDAMEQLGAVLHAPAVAASAHASADLLQEASAPVAPPAPAAEVALATAAEGAPTLPRVPITLVLNADLRAQRVTVTENGKTKYVWPISSGRPGFATPAGTFRPTWASRLWYSRQYELAPMPHAVFFNGGIAFHGTTAVGSLGSAASHGCIRLAPANAATLFNLVHRHGYWQTKVVVQGGSKRSDPAVARRGGDRQQNARNGRMRQTAGRPTDSGGQRPIYNVSRYGQPVVYRSY
jgi:L,D-transpeptidase-like protein